MEIDGVKDYAVGLAARLEGTPVESEMRAIVKDLEWAMKKVYVRKPSGKERVESIAASARKLSDSLDPARGWNDSAHEAFDELEDSVRRLRIEIARDTQTAT
ncbi:MAG: hypothetical protein M1570_10950 [Chloroflexi bacterium]|nr:hypothetical protein [Chloroflexota bacterium]